MARRKLGMIALLILAVWVPVTFAADGFRVDTAIYRGGEAVPLARNTTYFTDNTICDVSEHSDPERQSALLIHRSTNEATIMDGDRQVACTVSLDEILRTVAAISTRVKSKPPLVRFAAAPKFDVSWGEAGVLRMAAKPMRYEVRTQSIDDGSAAANYREFADWSARLNATRPGGLPPNARLALNAELAGKNCVPTRVELTRVIRTGDEEQAETTLYSTHQFQWRLTGADLDRVKQWNERAAGLAVVDLVTFRFTGQKPMSTDLK